MVAFVEMSRFRADHLKLMIESFIISEEEIFF